MNRRDEFVGGLTTFATMCYIALVNPVILSSGNSGIPFAGVMAATILVAVIFTIAAGIWTNRPFAIAPAMGLNTFVVFTLVLGKGVPWHEAFGICFYAGVLVLMICISGLSEVIVKAVPRVINTGATVGLGLFISLIGLKNSGLVEADEQTMLRFGCNNLESILSLTGLAITLALLLKKSSFAILAGIISVCLLGGFAGKVSFPQQWFTIPDLTQTFFKLDFVAALHWKNVPAIFALAFIIFFDSIAVVDMLSESCGASAEEKRKNLRATMILSSLATIFGACLGTSPSVVFLENRAGIEVGGRKKTSAFVTAACFLPLLFLAPLASLVPSYATAPALVVIGIMMFQIVRFMPFENLADALPGFVTLALMPFTMSIEMGLMGGFITYVLVQTVMGKWREVPATVYGLAVLSILLIVAQRM